MNDDTEDGEEGVFLTPDFGELSDIVCQRAVSLCKLAEAAYNYSDDAELRAELVLMMKKVNTSVALPTEVKKAKLTVLNTGGRVD